MAEILIGALFFLAGVAFFVVTLRQRNQLRRVSGVPAAFEIHDELALSAGKTNGQSAHSDTLAQPQPQPQPSLATAGAGAPSPAPPRESYYAVAPPSRAKGRPVGWYSADASLTEERYWDGRTWTARRQLVEGVWATVPVGD